MGLKIAVSGKGGVGKTTFSALVARALARRGMRVIAVDADPVTNLGAALGIPEDGMPTPISQMKDLILERTGAQPGTFGGYFKMNPRVDDIPDAYSAAGQEGVRLLVMGSVEKGGGGCICPESVLLKNLIQHLLLQEQDVVIMDMEAGVEHLGRATSRAVNVLVVVVDPGARSHFAARRIKTLAADIGLGRVMAVGNRTRNAEDEAALREALDGFEFLGFIPEDDRIREADRSGALPFPDIASAPAQLHAIVDKLLKL
jgi:CO dehydrogenase maturation factor